VRLHLLKVRRNLTIVSIFVVFLFSISSLAALPVSAASPPAITCSVTIVHENGGNNAIQQALNNAAAGVTGKVVCVDGGSYPEQLNITAATASGIELVGLGTSSNPTTIAPASVAVNTIDSDTGAPVAAIVVAGNNSAAELTGVVIHNIVVNGAAASSSFSSCSTDYRGVYFYDASGTVSNNTVENIYLPVADAGCQDGQGVYASTVSSLSSSISITHNSVLNYNKNGITCNDAGTTCFVSKNTVSFYTAYEPYIAPNGIQIGFGAVGVVSSNKVSYNVCTESNVCGINGYLGSGILTYLSGAGTKVTGNTLKFNDMGVASAYDAVAVNTNTIENATAVYGIGIYQLDGTYTAQSNTLSSNPFGFVLQSDGNPSNLVSTVGNKNHFTSDPVLIQIQTFSPGIATVHFHGFTYHLSGNAELNITSP
jgi:hypothetical protein